MIHDSFPMGIHPIGQLIPRSATLEGIGSVWAGAGNTTPSAIQLQLIQDLKPTILAGMSSYCLHLGNVAAANGIDMAGRASARSWSAPSRSPRPSARSSGACGAPRSTTASA